MKGSVCDEIDLVFGFTIRCFQLKSESFSYRVSEKSAIDEFKKQKKMINLVWRPISTQSSSIITETGNDVREEAQCNKSSDVSEEFIEGGRSETASVVYAGKHSVSLEVGASLIKFIRGKSKISSPDVSRAASDVSFAIYSNKCDIFI
ncbi:PREDICTED: uncharacterized protein LOC104709289 [Camelina sativa]|uniref:Uncharacterized protein LOC104709289 n=1 Tax=Camelina sativa TaxID=90675 RepID=A0ABM0TCL1_CAMSA|nr:PREDICTED: uncharacterized protein LOC104709289 [Camelina sativa]